MKYLQTEAYLGDAECAADAVRPVVEQENRLAEIQAELTGVVEATRRAELLVEAGYLLLDLERNDEAWQSGHEAFRLARDACEWELAAQSCDIIYQSERDDALVALAHGVWLAVTYPVDPELSVHMLKHLVDETPPKADAAGVAAAAASYLVELRATGDKRSELQFFTAGMLAEVAKKHSEVVDNKEIFDFWVERLELNDPGKVLPRLAKILDVLVPGAWWYDRDALRAALPTD